MIKKISSVCFLLSITLTNQTHSSPLEEAANLQSLENNKQSQESQRREEQETTKKFFQDTLNDIFYLYFQEVDKSNIKLESAKEAVERINRQRSITGGCCQIHISQITDDEKFLITSSGSAIFAIKGYGTQSISGKFHDDEYEKSGLLSYTDCQYEIFFAHNLSKKYNCLDLFERKLDNEVINDLLNALPKKMKDYKR